MSEHAAGLIEGGWKSFAAACALQAGSEEYADQRRTFFSGALTLFAILHPSNDLTPTKCMLELVEVEFRGFLEIEVVGHLQRVDAQGHA